ncbi:hypothetical protein P7D22_21170 [Lichenihabitans sp. Uapishka_5]|uniref:hypothetical protein n=1 Tax=Lichenihabitans sp. Uapishka_5 TaxID=3037302 RepID=UPI0029E808AD|nr:hypothetical protein [Lichenihabitans sp. Uapishka_5]MDX7953679.1 hypothetical protein [Lichenihabitans sp. Uapishka_5]
MPGKRENVLRAYHLLVVRGPEGFTWQVRYDRHANPVERSAMFFPSHAAAEMDGGQALEKHRAAAPSE